VVDHDQAVGAGPHRLLDKSIKRPAQRHQARPFLLEYLPDRPLLELRMPGPLRVGNALIRQPGVQLDQALHPRVGQEQQVAQVADLVLDLTVRATYAAFGHGSPEPQPEAGVHATGSIK
jgi:hypothetical protein